MNKVGANHLLNKIYKIFGKSKYYETLCGIKVINPHHFRGQAFPCQEIEIDTSLLYIGNDALNDEYTLVGTPIAQSPYYELVRLLSQNLPIDNCDYIKRKTIGALDGRDGIKLNIEERKRHYNDFLNTKESLLNNSYLLPIVYEIGDKYYIYDGKHHVATACLLGMPIRCRVVDIYYFARDSYSMSVYSYMYKTAAKYSKNLTVYEQYIHVKKPKCLVVNRCRTDNLGDQAIGLSMLKLIETVGEQADLTEFSKAKGSELIYQSSKGKAYSAPKKRLLNNPLIRQLLFDFKWKLENNNLFHRIYESQYDYIYIGGGELLQSNGQFPLALYEWCKNIRKKQKKAKIILFSVGVTKVFSEHDRYLVKRALDYVDDIFVRDELSRENLKLLFGKDSIVIPDVVFGCDLFEGKCTNRERVGVLYGITDSMRILRYNKIASTQEEYFEYSYTDICKFLSDGISVRLFYTTQSDRDACLLFQDYFSRKCSQNIQIEETYSLNKLMNSMRQAKIVVSPRMHGCILGYLAGVKTVPVLISNKMESFNLILNQGINIAEKKEKITTTLKKTMIS